MRELTPKSRSQFFHVGLVNDLEQHLLLLVLGFPAGALLGLFQIAHAFDVLEIFDVFHQLFVFLCALCELVRIYTFLLGQKLI